MNNSRKLIGSQLINVNISKSIIIILYFSTEIFVSEIFIFLLIVFLKSYFKKYSACLAKQTVHAASNFGNFCKKQSKLSDISVIEFL